DVAIFASAACGGGPARALLPLVARHPPGSRARRPSPVSAGGRPARREGRRRCARQWM
ncbi:MAG: hypothetical protein AVDCRST_MAG67-1477, partial [uncultured Solirubrobacteraceae bacterium]